MAEWAQVELWPGAEPLELVPAYINEGRLKAHGFSKRERQATCGVCLGLTNVEIALRLSTTEKRISERTVATYVVRAMGKADVKNRVELSGWAQVTDKPEEHGLRLVV